MNKKIKKIESKKTGIKRKPDKIKVITAMSGGMDSSVAAAFLKEAGYNVIGVFMKLDDLKSSIKNERRAKIVAKKLGVSFRVLNLRKVFREKVIKPFVREHKKGKTPNPCVVCNKEVKFNFLLKELKKLKADFVATGHYARTREGKLLRGRDKEKDQSYFLWQLNQRILNNVLFPVGGYKKSEVKELAKEFKLPVLNVLESQEICFIETTVNDFLEKYLRPNPGLIVEKIFSNKGQKVLPTTITGTDKRSDVLKNIRMPKGYRVLGKHKGLAFYTIGQRKGIKLPGGPFYVLRKDLKRNFLIITKNEKSLYKKELIAENVNWISGKTPKFPLKAMAKIRYRHKPALVVINKQKEGRIKVVFAKPQRAITAGQSVVFYLPAGKASKGEEVLGGGIIWL